MRGPDVMIGIDGYRLDEAAIHVQAHVRPSVHVQLGESVTIVASDPQACLGLAAALCLAADRLRQAQEVTVR